MRTEPLCANVSRLAGGTRAAPCLSSVDAGTSKPFTPSVMNRRPAAGSTGCAVPTSSMSTSEDDREDNAPFPDRSVVPGKVQTKVPNNVTR